MMEKRNKSKNHELSFLGSSLSSVFSAKNWTSQWRLFRLVEDWPTIVGTEIGRLTSPAFFRRDVLWIFVQDSAWMQHLQFIKIDLLTRVNRVLQENPITDIRWLLPPQIPQIAERHLPEPHPVNPEQEQMFEGMAESVRNQDCREALRHLWQIFASYSE